MPLKSLDCIFAQATDRHLAADMLARLRSQRPGPDAFQYFEISHGEFVIVGAGTVPESTLGTRATTVMKKLIREGYVEPSPTEETFHHGTQKGRRLFPAI